MNNKIRKGDKVIVVAGNDKGKTGQVLARKADRVLVQGINLRKKHLRRTQQMQGGRIVEMETPIHISNIAFCTKEGEKVKMRVRSSKGSPKELVYQSSGAEVVHRTVKKPA